MKHNPEVIAYIDSQPVETRQRLMELRAMIRAAYPASEETMYGPKPESQFPIYKLGETWVSGFAARSKGPMLYVCDQDVVDKYRDKLGALADGKACVAYKITRTLDKESLRAIFKAMLLEAAAKKEFS